MEQLIVSSTCSSKYYIKNLYLFVSEFKKKKLWKVVWKYSKLLMIWYEAKLLLNEKRKFRRNIWASEKTISNFQGIIACIWCINIEKTYIFINKQKFYFKCESIIKFNELFQHVTLWYSFIYIYTIILHIHS